MSNVNIEERLAKLTKKIKDDLKKNYDLQLIEEKRDMLNTLREMFPELNSEKNKKIIENLIGEEDYTPNGPEIVLEKFSHNGKDYYKDNKNCIWDDGAQMVGVIIDNGKSFECNFFDKQIGMPIVENIELPA